jgi:FAD/FMN-containing dehydrogenase
MSPDPRLTGISTIVGAGNVLWRDADKAPSLTDWRGRYTGEALAVVRPASTDEVSRVMAEAARQGLNIVPQGGNTGMCAAATPLAAAQPCIVLKLDRMNRIRWVSPLGDCMAVDAGCILHQVQQAASEANRLFPLSLGAEGSCQIGGNIATNAGGTAALRYGTMRDLVLGLEVVLADGRVLDLMTALRKNSTGYDMRHMFIGSEGTLGVVTGAVLKLFPQPRDRRTAFASAATMAGVLGLLALARETCGDSLGAFEVLNREQIAVIAAHRPELRQPFPDAPWCVLVEVADMSVDGSLGARLEALLAEALERGLMEDATLAVSEAHAKAFWAIRHAVSESSRAAGYVVSHDSVVPLFQQERFVQEAEAAIRAVSPEARVAIHGHIGDGNLHVLAILPQDAGAEVHQRKAAEVSAAVDAVTARLGGAISAEHGIGHAHVARLAAAVPKERIALMAGMKHMLDPEGRMNPGKIFRAG